MRIACFLAVLAAACRLALPSFRSIPSSPPKSQRFGPSTITPIQSARPSVTIRTSTSTLCLSKPWSRPPTPCGRALGSPLAARGVARALRPGQGFSRAQAAAYRGKRRRLRELGTRSARDRNHARQSRRHGTGPGAAALSVGAVRRCADVSAQQRRLGRQELRSQERSSPTKTGCFSAISRNAVTSEPPASFDDYLKKVVTATLERHKSGGAVAVKFEAAYLRSLHFDDPSRAEAARVYSASRRAAPSDASYKQLQDYIFRYIAAECGRLDLPVHLHSAAGGGGYFNVAGANPLGLESVLNDPKLRKTNFVMVHGGWPFTREVAALLSKPNAYADFSEQTFSNYPRAVAGAIREWLEYAPEKVMFATDAYPFSEEMGWEEAGWVAGATGRQALGFALTEMMHDGEITRARALEIARLVLRDNARKLYHLK